MWLSIPLPIVQPCCAQISTASSGKAILRLWMWVPLFRWVAISASSLESPSFSSLGAFRFTCVDVLARQAREWCKQCMTPPPYEDS